MSASEELSNDQDPDYVSANCNDQTQQKIFEENARNTTARKITNIVEKEFSREINSKEEEVLKIQEKLHKALKTLHFLRYVIITDFYNHKQCQISQTTETSKQTRIHPAVKSLLGKSPKIGYCVEPAIPSTSTDPRFLPVDESLTSGIDTTADSLLKTNKNTDGYDETLQNKKRRLSENESQVRKTPRYIPPKSIMPTNEGPSRGERHKLYKRIIVGNISKWIPPDWREDNATHKWTVYVRGDKDNPNISTFVNKVRFFLHSSYRPNDVVEVTSYPFHLSRRGWGEFPLRVQLHFKNSLNKPVDIIHHLKLDHTCTGLQTLGLETMVDLWIYTTTRIRDQNISESLESVTNNTSEEIKKNEYYDNMSGLTHDQLAKSAGTSNCLKSQFITDTCEEIQVKKEITNSEICKFPNSLIVLRPTEELKGAKIKVESNDATSDLIIPFFADSNKSTLEQKRFYINHDHNYSNEQYFSFQRRTVKEGNVTIEHFVKKECPTTNSLTNSTGSENGTIILHKGDSDIQSSKPPMVSNLKENNSRTFQLSEHATSNENDQINLSFDSNKSLQRKDSKSNNDSRLFKDFVADTATMTNGFSKSSNAPNDQMTNVQKTTTLSYNSHLTPLKISIPPLFDSSTSKRIFLTKNKKVIPVEVIDGNTKMSSAKLNNSRGVSILKKPPMNSIKVKTQQESNTVENNKTARVLTLKGTNSLLLNVNYDVPALKIADPYDPRYNCNLTDTTKSNAPRERSQDDKTIQRTKVTLGKDKHKIQSKKELYEKTLQSIESTNIVDTEAFIRFIIRRLPIVTQDARDPEYKCLHPYACCSEKDFLAHNIGKQRAVEWYRAKTIRYFLQKKLISDDRLWSVKEIMIWARLHGYTPSRCALGIREIGATNNTKRLPDSSASTAFLPTCTKPIEFQKWLQVCQEKYSHLTMNPADVEEVDIDVESIDESKSAINRIENIDNNKNSNCLSVNSTLIPLEFDENLFPLHNFVCDTARDIGIKILSEEIIPGVAYCAASRVIMRVIECFVEDLIRSSLARAWEKNISDECPKIITLDDVRNALTNREEFDIFTNEGLGFGIEN